MIRLTRRAAVTLTAALAAVLTLAGCAQPAIRTSPNPRPFPAHVAPAQLDGLNISPEPRAAAAFRSAGSSSAVQKGAVWTLRSGSQVVGALEVAQLKGGLTTRNEAVKAGIRNSVNNGYYRWFKILHRQWVGVQLQPQLVIYLWLPPRHDEFEILQLSSNLPQPEQVLTDLIAYQEAG